MKIKPTIYKELSNNQRLKASLDAILRGDKQEASRLLESCEQKTYQQADHGFTDVLIERLASRPDITSEDKIEALLRVWNSAKGTQTDLQTINVNTTIIHKRSADWPPEDIPEDHFVSDEFIPTRSRGKTISSGS